MTPITRHPGPASSRRGAFTLVELLVVISILVLILAIGVPAFSSLLYSSDQSLSENAVRSGLSSARDAAARSASGQDAAAVFFFDNGRTSIVPCVSAGEVLDFRDNDPTQPMRRELFVPVPGLSPAQLPRGWAVRGYALPGMLDTEWYEDSHPNGQQRPGTWILPETSFFDSSSGIDGEDRQTFLVRFEGGTGRFTLAGLRASLVLSPAPSDVFRQSGVWASYRVDREPDGARFARRVSASTLPPGQKVDLLGDRASDTVLAKPVGQLAVCSEARLAGALGARLDPATECLYAAGVDPAFVTVPGFSNLPAAVTQWIEGRLPAAGGGYVSSDARIFGVQAYLGWLNELTGSREVAP